jgi:MinD-like ATPase involved in chromosome partitioning or flagellar assembly
VPEICEGSDLGLPVVAAFPESPASEAFREIASQLAASVSIQKFAETRHK